MKCDILDKAAERVMKGWCKGSRHYDGMVCALGAIEVATLGREGWPYAHNDQAEYHPDSTPIVMLLATVIDPGFNSRDVETRRPWDATVVIANWNNQDERTAEEVASKMREAAGICRTQVAATLQEATV